MRISTLWNKLFKRRTRPEGVFVGRARTRDIAITYRMVAGFPGDVNRTHPASIEPVLIDAGDPPTAYGQLVVVDAATEGVRPIGAGDGALTDGYGITVRPWPQQQASATNYGQADFGSATPPANGIMDVAKQAYIMVVCNNAAANPPVKGQPVYVWYAASAGNHVQGGFEAAATGGSTFELPADVTWNGGADANGVAELVYHR